MSWSIRIQTHGPQRTQELGEVIGRNAQPGDIYLLIGPLGAGKTCLSQGIARGLEVPEHLRSPTFVLMTRRQGRLALNHLDLYRINDPWEAWDLGVDEQLFDAGVCIVEWADKAAELFPPESCWIALEYGPDESQRAITITVTSPRYDALLRRLTAAFSVGSGAPLDHVVTRDEEITQ